MSRYAARNKENVDRPWRSGRGGLFSVAVVFPHLFIFDLLINAINFARQWRFYLYITIFCFIIWVAYNLAFNSQAGLRTGRWQILLAKGLYLKAIGIGLSILGLFSAGLIFGNMIGPLIPKPDYLWDSLLFSGLTSMVSTMAAPIWKHHWSDLLPPVSMFCFFATGIGAYLVGDVFFLRALEIFSGRARLKQQEATHE